MSKEKILKQGIGTKGYFAIVLCKNGIPETHSIHKLESMAFLGHKPNGTSELVINHKDYIRINNFLYNLEIITTRENTNLKHIPHTSKYTGVCWYEAKNKWQSAITVNGKIVYLGRFDDEYEAHLYYENAVKSIENGTEIATKKEIKTSAYKGVSWNTKSCMWIATITVNSKTKYLGRFKTELDAHNTFLEAKEKLTQITSTL